MLNYIDYIDYKKYKVLEYTRISITAPNGKIYYMDVPKKIVVRKI